MRKTLTALFLFLGATTGVAHADATIVILRHGEKPAAGLGQLNCQGLQRALRLPGKIIRTYGTPAAIYAPNPAVKKADLGRDYNYIRPLATIEPLAIQAGMPVQLDWSMKQTDELAAHLLSQTGLQVVAWEHHWAVKLARELVRRGGGNAEAVPAWPGNDFDSLYVVRVDSAGKARFTREAQALSGLPEQCPAY